MKNRFFPTLLLFALLFAACAPAAVTDAPVQQAATPIAVAASATPLAEGAVPTLAVATQAPVVEVPSALPIATSRGPDLHATDPATVSLASGQLHFVEFFRFT